MARPRKEDRKRRVPLGVARPHLEVEQRQGYKRRWINDTGDRLQQAESGGYQFVMKEDAVFPTDGDDVAKSEKGLGSKICKSVGVKEDGTPLKAYLMEIRQDWYEEDQAEKQKRIDQREESIRRGKDLSTSGEMEGKQYVPSTGMKIEHVKS